MLFYRATAKLANEPSSEKKKDRNERMDIARHIASKTDEFNQRKEKTGYCFVSSIGKDDISCGMIFVSSCDVANCAKAFFETIQMDYKDLNTDEITLSSLYNLLDRANRSDYIVNDDTVLEQFGLDSITGPYVRGIDFSDNLLDAFTNKKDLYSVSVKMHAEETLKAELDRIYTGNDKVKAFGHPVHYFVEADDNETSESLYCTLLQALYDRGRLHNRRYCTVKIETESETKVSLYDALYKSSVGGAVVVRILANGDSVDNDCASSEQDTISMLCKTMVKYRKQVLTVFCLPRAGEKIKKSIIEELGPIGMVSIREDLLDTAKAQDYLKTLCRENHIRSDKQLHTKVNNETVYHSSELRNIFEEWYDNKLRTTVYSQYKDIAINRKEAIKAAPRGSAIEELNEMIGLQNVKEIIAKALNYYKLQKIFKDRGVKSDRPALHMVFSGNPGTAKTTVARLFARIMKENGLLSRGQLVEVGRGDLVGKYVGWTAQIVKEKFKAAMGGVLFIDEAYSLVDERGGSYGDEAINTIVQEMENKREDLVVILAGYPHEMETFLNKNPGLRSRIAFHVPFSDYDSTELCEIARLIGKAKGVTLTEAAIAKLSSLFESAKQQPDFGNGRYVRNTIELSKMNQANRLLAMDPDKITDTMLATIEESDIQVPELKAEVKRKAIGFY